ncbi:Holliday junction branch migration protein RuvA [Saccharobesus litoralis]|uniref:Holliday junction branch migration complex subunit RuvA n=1 Tax=Saccharobesus litoralis TaxID=2172099 RepID=A0A2S0VWJ7_9ALTE|nr:Holliday junction branch migration protein RuvA [Saccharobesus litoralis]AWB68565.1 Holliday junction branch migration protein RuvA [Saccharobesus litoralis]
MIVRLTGVVIEKTPPQCVLEVNGVGYEVNLPMTSFYNLPQDDSATTLFMHQVFREDSQALYGFHAKFERDLFRELLKANGVGPKLALAILSAMSGEDFIWAVNQADISRIVKVPGVGKKTAERLLLEMSDRLKNWRDIPATPTADSQASNMDMVLEPATNPVNDAVDALIALGYKANQAETTVKKVAKVGMTSEAIIKDALKAML